MKNCDYKALVTEMIEKGIKVDAIITDPPYCVSRTHQLGFSNMGRAGMNYGKWDYGFDQKEWITICAPIVKVGGSAIIFNDWKNLSYMVEELEKCGFVIKDLIRWEKKNPMPRNVNSRYVMDFEVAIWAVKGEKKWTFNKPSEVSYIKPVFRTGVVPGGKNRIHPTQKNLSVIEQLVLIHTNIDDVVFDPFSGSGTTAVACVKSKRNFIGSEIDEKYYKKSVARLDDNISVELSGK
ncbi:MAG: site-specific DNA-methyltransferase [Firmicutes bacterium]|nr:site-specific DNA-methyltransferase [Bacillota bacterium]